MSEFRKHEEDPVRCEECLHQRISDLRAERDKWKYLAEKLQAQSDADLGRAAKYREALEKIVAMSHRYKDSYDMKMVATVAIAEKGRKCDCGGWLTFHKPECAAVLNAKKKGGEAL